MGYALDAANTWFAKFTLMKNYGSAKNAIDVTTCEVDMEALEIALMIWSVGFTGAALILAYGYNRSNTQPTETEIKNKHNFSIGIAVLTFIMIYVVFIASFIS